MISPAKTAAQVNAESLEGKHLYKVSHNDFEVGKTVISFFMEGFMQKAFPKVPKFWGLDSRSPPKIRCDLCIVGKQSLLLRTILKIHLWLWTAF